MFVVSFSNNLSPLKSSYPEPLLRSIKTMDWRFANSIRALTVYLSSSIAPTMRRRSVGWRQSGASPGSAVLHLRLQSGV